MSRYVGIDLHRRRSQVVILSEDGEKVSSNRIVNDSVTLVEEVAAAGPEPEVVLGATWGWYWAADVLSEAGCRVRLVHSSVDLSGVQPPAPRLGVGRAEPGEEHRGGSERCR